MKTKFIPLAIAALAMAMTACSNDDQVPEMPKVNDGSISFSTYLNRTSRAASTTTANLSAFGVHAYYNDGAAYASTASLVPDFMYNQKVQKNGTDWEYSPLKYWSNDPAKKTSFIAYAPYTATPAAMTGNASGITAMSANNYAGDPTLTYEVGTDISKQKDLIYASAIDQTNAVGTVNFNFKHALARVFFNVVGWEPGTGETFDAGTTVTINSVQLCTFRKSATLNLKSGVWGSSVVESQPRSYKISTSNGLLQNNVITSGTTATKRLNKADDYMMIFPELATTGHDQYYVLVDYTVKTVDPSLAAGYNENRQVVYRYLSPNFQAGKSYAITIHLGMNGYSGDDDGDGPGTTPTNPDPETGAPNPVKPGEANYIKFSASVTDWDNVADAIDIPLNND